MSLWAEQEPLGWSLSTRHNAQHYSHDNADNVSRQVRWLDAANDPYLKKWEDVLRRFGPLQPRLDGVLLKHFYEGRAFLARVIVDPPTHHEQLEARLELREWTQTHLPPGVQKELERLEA